MKVAIMLTITLSLAPFVHAQQTGELLVLPDYRVWCSDASIPKDATDAAYRSSLDEAVKSIDKGVGSGASTGAPFAASSVKKVVKTKLATGNEVDTDMLDVTVCMAVPNNEGAPSRANIRSELRSGEKVFARACSLAATDTCIDDLRTALSARLGNDQLAAQVGSLVWRSVPIKTATADAMEMRRVLVSSDIRLVTLAPEIEGSGDRDLAAVLTRPIEQQTPRPLITKNPSAFSIKATPQAKGVVVAITLSPEMFAALTAPPVVSQ